jgi:hypothetical protein
MRKAMIVAVLCAAVPPALAGSWTTIYSQDFSSEPTEWITNDASSYYWTGDAYFIKHMNDSGYYAYTPLDFDPKQSWVLEYDFKITSIDGGEVALGFWDPLMRYETFEHEKGSSYARFLSGVPHPLIGTTWVGEDRVMIGDYERPGVFEFSKWYHNRAEFDADAGTCRLVTTPAEGGEPIVDFTLSGITGSHLLASDATRLGSSGVGHWTHGSLTGEGYIDNISVQVIPEPVSIVSGVIALGMVGAYVRKRRST